MINVWNSVSYKLINVITYESIWDQTIGNDGFSNPWIVSSISLMFIGAMLPCLIWFIRNFMRIILKKNYEVLNRSLKWISLGGFIIFLVGIIIISLLVSGVIT